MMLRFWQNTLARLPRDVQYEIRRFNYYRQIRRGSFTREDPELREISRHVQDGDWVIDVGANVGRYSSYMARRVGSTGRVLAFEPLAVSFALLAANTRAAGLRNVTLFNVALSSASGLASMTVPSYDCTRLDNYYRAHIAVVGEYEVLCLPLDAIPLPHPVSLVKIDAEGYDLQVLLGMESLVQRDQPVVLVEGWTGGPAASWLEQHGYSVRAVANSPNVVAVPASPSKRRS